MTALRGVGVLVTRPAQQAAPLCSLLEAAGAAAVRLAAIELEPAQDLQALRDRVGPIADFDLVIFTSANAVRFGAALLAGSRKPTLAAIGPATARALDAAGQRVTLMPVAGYDSESLLRQPALARLQGQRVLLVKGMHGRDLLQDQLAQRGAHVTVADVYRRVCARHDGAVLAAVEAQLAAGAIQVMTATSAQIAANLVEMATPALRREFAHVHWLVPGTRVAAAVRALGVTAPILQADSAEDHDLVAAIVRWRGGVSGA